jgi:hypothetical protein
MLYLHPVKVKNRMYNTMKKSKQFTLNITTDGPSGKNKSLINLKAQAPDDFKPIQRRKK